MDLATIMAAATMHAQEVRAPFLPTNPETLGSFLLPMGWLSEPYGQVITSEAATPSAVCSVLEARWAIAEKRSFGMAASRLREEVAKAQSFLAGRVRTPVFGSSIVVSLSEPLSVAAPPVFLGAYLAPAPGLSDYLIVENPFVFKGQQEGS